MLQSLTLDAFVILILLLLSLLGFMRGGLREVCSAAGLLFGVAMVSQWATSLGDWLARSVNIDQGAGRFIGAVFILLVSTMICGYGAGSAFVYQPAPGGRMYGGLLGLLVGVVFVGYVINYVSVYLLDGSYPAVVKSSYIARALSVGIDWVLLAVAGVIVLATAFGLLVREQAPDQYMQSFRPIPPDMGYGKSAAEVLPKAKAATPTDKTEKVEPAPATAPVGDPALSDTQTAPMRIREVRHWEEPVSPPTDLHSGWSQTWPVSASGTPPKPLWDTNAARRRQQTPAATERSTPGARPDRSKPQNDAEVLREWLAQDDDTPGPNRPKKDE